MKLECFRIGPYGRLVPSVHDRQWMEAFPDRHAYRCLPLAIANSHGWDILNPLSVEVTWTGGNKQEDLKIRALDPAADSLQLEAVVRSNFTQGIVTFHTGFLFRTEPGWSLMVTGPINRPKLNLYPLTAIIETAWLPYPFTMNWQVLAAGTYIFAKDEPICTVMPVPHEYIEKVELEIYNLKDDAVLEYEHDMFRDERASWMQRRRDGDAATLKEAWQRHYFLGRFPSGLMVDDHVNKMRPREPVDRTGQKPSMARMTPRAESKTVPWTSRSGSAKAEPRNADSSAPGLAASHELPRLLFQSGKIPVAQLEEFISGGQSEKNRSGRERLKDGILVSTIPGDAPVEVCPSDNADFIIIDDVLGDSECSAFCDPFRSNWHSVRKPDGRHPYWAGRTIHAHELIFSHLPLALRMKELCRYSTELIEKFYNLDQPLYADTSQLVCWPEGMHMDPHADNAHPDGRKHGMPWRRFASIIYLNDDYEGGNLYMTALNRLIKPKRGRLIAFTGGFHHEHAVLKITAGTRYTMPSFFTCDEERADAFIYG